MKGFLEKIKKRAKSDTDFSISLKDFAEYCKNHGTLIAFTLAIIALAHGAYIFSGNFGIDTQVFVQQPEFDYNWVGIGRFGLLLERDLLFLKPYSLYYAGVLMYIFISLACITMYYTFYKISGKDYGFVYLCIPLICFTHPIFVEQFYFKLQCAQIAFATFITVLRNFVGVCMD